MGTSPLRHAPAAQTSTESRKRKTTEDGLTQLDPRRQLDE